MLLVIEAAVTFDYFLCFFMLFPFQIHLVMDIDLSVRCRDGCWWWLVAGSLIAFDKEVFSPYTTTSAERTRVRRSILIES